MSRRTVLAIVWVLKNKKINILAKGKIPFIECSLLPSGDIRVCLTTVRRNSRYIAISYIGIGLLGNLIIAVDCLVNLAIILLKPTIDLGIIYFLNPRLKELLIA